MIPQLSATSIRQAMRWAGDERRLGQACQAVLGFMQRHAIAATWGRSDLASSDMMSMETTQRVWQARQHPRRNTSSIGIYSHVRDRWGIFHAQPFVVNERQAGVAIETSDLCRAGEPGTGQAGRGDAGGRPRLESVGQHHHGLERGADAGRADSLGQPALGNTGRTHGQDRTDAPAGDQFTGCVSLPGGALCQ